ncbi:MAG: PEP-CTERM sorting domain-containing protein [Myxococcales bacterium]|nr:PEP-CTERM sorting domain-containing protein [Myxococcales bacterium]
MSDIERIPPSAVGSIAGRVEMVRQPLGDSRVADENERARLIADIARLIREPTVPEPTRVAGLTLIGWLARRRPEESPHAIGVSEALESERRLRAAK